MSRILCNFVIASKHEPCNPHTQNVILTHGTMLPVWSSDRAHAGRCLAKADCRCTSSKTAMGLKKKWPGPHGKGTRLYLLMVFLVADIFQGSTWCDVLFDMGEQSPSQLTMFFMQWRPRLWHRAVFSI